MALPLQFSLGQFAPTFEELARLLLNFGFAWLSRYWWFVMIVGILWYTRWYQIFFQRLGRTPDTATRAFQALAVHVAALSVEGMLAIAGLAIAAIGGLGWAAQGLTALGHGVIFLDPVMVANAVGLVAAIGAGLGLDFITLRITVAAAIVLAVGAFALRTAAFRWG